jgi:hypothetical protein
MSAANSGSPVVAAKRGRGPFLLVLAAVATVAALVGAYLDWLWWVAYKGLMITLMAIGLLIVGGIVAMIRRRLIRRTGLVILAAGIGLLIGQIAGPSREPLLYQLDGTITLHLESPVEGTATGAVNCTNVASQTEFQVSGDPNVRLDTDRSFVWISIDTGDRWAALDSGPRSNGVSLWIAVTPEAVTDKGPATIGMHATQGSTVDATFANQGGRLRFSGLEPISGPDYTGASLDLAGTIEWSCGPAMERDAVR